MLYSQFCITFISILIFSYLFIYFLLSLITDNVMMIINSTLLSHNLHNSIIVPDCKIPPQILLLTLNTILNFNTLHWYDWAIQYWYFRVVLFVRWVLLLTTFSILLVYASWCIYYLVLFTFCSMCSMCSICNIGRYMGFTWIYTSILFINLTNINIIKYSRPWPWPCTITIICILILISCIM